MNRLLGSPILTWRLGKLPLLLVLCSLSPAYGEENACNWVKVTDKAGWQPRDSQGELVFRDQLWMFGGWFQSFESPPRDVWNSADGKEWKCVTNEAAWKHSDLPMSLTFQDKMWMMGGWYNGRLPGHSASSEVWWSTDGANWKQLSSEMCWKERHEHSAFVFQDKIWVAGGHAQPLSSEVWSLELPEDFEK